MLDLIHPASNDLLLVINRNGPSTAQEWSAARRNALTLAEAGSLLMPQVNSDVWRAAAKELSDAGAHAYTAAQTKDIKALAAATARVDASCTTCHKQFRPNVFPKQGA
jgi:cytochrome c556